MKKFFKKIRDYVRNTAWIQPLLIVVVIFLVLFLLSPIKNGISKLWTSITTSSNMKTITYQEYVEKVNDSKDDDKYIFVFTQKNCEVCPQLYPIMNDYLKATKKTRDFEIYSVNLTTKTKNNATYYKDKTLGNYTGKSDDYAKQLDNRLVEWHSMLNAVSNEQTQYGSLTEVSEGFYQYLSTPLIIWYVGGIEVKVSNTFDATVSKDSNGDRVYSSFKSYMEFPTAAQIKTLSVEWNAANDAFDLPYKTK